MSIIQPPHPESTKVLACATVIEEMMPFMPPGMEYEVFDFGLHRIPENLKKSLQEAIDKAGEDYDTVILGYGLCSLAVVGLQARDCTLVVPKVDDCIAIYLGSGEAYSEQSKMEPGTYYLTKGWIEVSDTILDEYQTLLEKYDEERADFVMGEMLKHYKRLVYIDTGTENQGEYRAYAKKVAAQFKLSFEEIRGSNELVQKMLIGPWDGEFVVAPPGTTIQYKDFKDYK
jgi:hypothetical protein